MKHFYRFRITKKQLSMARKLLLEENSHLIISLCGRGYFCTHNLELVSYSVQNNIINANLYSLETMLNTNTNHPCGIAFYHNDPGHERHAEILSSDKRMLINNHTDTKISCFISEESIICYVMNSTGWQLVNTVSIVAGTIKYIFSNNYLLPSDFNIRTIQAFGQGTTNILSKLSVGIVGVSGTGSIVAEQLFRLGIEELILVDNDIVEDKNLGRILNSTQDDVRAKKNKAEMLRDNLARVGLPTNIIAIPTLLNETNTIHRLSQCDVIFGCVDSVNGRAQLNRLCTYYSIPYFDLGVKLQADGNGGLNEITNAIHYIQPGGSSLYTRGVYSSAQLTAAALKENNPVEYDKQKREKYIVGGDEDSPAVISVNMLCAALAVNDFLARIHDYREDGNDVFEAMRIELTAVRLFYSEPSQPDSALLPFVGRGDEEFGLIGLLQK